MNIESFLLSDSAHDYHGKLCIVGAFDTIGAHQAPFHHHHCSVSARIRFQRSEEGQHKIRIVLIDDDGQRIGPNLEHATDITLPPQLESGSINVVLNMGNLNLPRFGVYHFDLVVDGELRARLPIHVVRAPQPAQIK